MPQKQKQKTTTNNNNYRKLAHNLHKALAWHFQGLDFILSKTSQNKIKSEGKRGNQEDTQSQPHVCTPTQIHMGMHTYITCAYKYMNMYIHTNNKV